MRHLLVKAHPAMWAFRAEPQTSFCDLRRDAAKRAPTTGARDASHHHDKREKQSSGKDCKGGADEREVVRRSQIDHEEGDSRKKRQKR